MEDYKEKYELGSIVTAIRTFNGETITGEFGGFHLLDKSNPKSIVGIVHTPNGSYDVEPDSIESVISEDERIKKTLIQIVKGACDDFGIKYKGIEITEEKLLAWIEKHVEQKPDKCVGCNNFKGCVTCTDGDQYAHITEQKPIDKVEPKFKVGDRIYDKRDSYNRNVIREVGKDYYINAFAQKMDMAYTDANFEFIEHLEDDHIDSKSTAWSEEDERMFTLCASSVQTRYNDGLLTSNEYEQASLWLKAIKERVQPQPKKEWSEEDETKIVKLKSFIAQCNGFNKENRKKVFDLIDSIKLGCVWKPSDEQMKALKCINLTGGISYIGQGQELINLYNDLKKLKEE